MIPEKINLKNNLFLIIAVVFSLVGAILIAASMDDGPGPPPKRPVVPTGFTPQMLKEKDSLAAQHFIKFCGQCHDLPDPKSHTAEDWPEVVARMTNRLRRMRFFSSRAVWVPGDETVNQIIAYLSQQGLKKAAASLTEDKTPAGLLFLKKCAQCHGLPDPTLHTPTEWPRVVERMRGNIARMQKEPISDTEKETLVRYLSQFGQPVGAATPLR